MLGTGISVICQAAAGTFASEYYVKIQSSTDVLWQGVVDKEVVFELEGTPSHEQFVKGRMYAYLISYNEESAVIELPVENSFIGRRISVPISFLRKERIPV